MQWLFLVPVWVLRREKRGEKEMEQRRWGEGKPGQEEGRKGFLDGPGVKTSSSQGR